MSNADIQEMSDNCIEQRDKNQSLCQEIKIHEWPALSGGAESCLNNIPVEIPLR